MSFPFRDPSVGALEKCCGYCPLAFPLAFEGPALPVGGLPSVASIGGTGFPIAGLISLLCAGMSWFAAVFGRLKHCRYG